MVHAPRSPGWYSFPSQGVVKRDGKLVGDHVDHALELMHAAREHLRA
jgi:hypothetical protein